MAGYYYRWQPYVPVHKRREQAARKIAGLRKRGHATDPVVTRGRTIAHTFWGKAWCENLESYSDFANRLPRGRTYLRNGSVIDLQIGPGRVEALVSGSSIYRVDIAVRPAAKPRWRALARECSGKIESVLELLQGRLSEGVMRILARRDTGLFPSPGEISMRCSCPDWATMCKHVAAVLYGVGARLDAAPEKLFVLRKVDHTDLVARAGTARGLGRMAASAKARVLEPSDLSGIFGIDLEGEPAPDPPPPARPRPSAEKTRARSARKSAPGRKRASMKTAPVLVARPSVRSRPRRKAEESRRRGVPRG